MTQGIEGRLAAAGTSDADELERLRGELARRAKRSGDLDVAWRVVDAPIGRLLLAATDEGLVRVGFEREGFDGVLQSLADRISPRVLEAPARLDAPARALERYFAGGAGGIRVPLDLRLATGIVRRVVEHLRAIPYGAVESYGEVARAIELPAAVRAVGTACGRNPLPVVVACHRVVRSDGSLGNYGGGPEVKRFLLELEGAVPAGGG